MTIRRIFPLRVILLLTAKRKYNEYSKYNDQYNKILVEKICVNITYGFSQTDEEVTTSENSTSNDENVTTNESDEYDLSGKIICSSTVIHDENPFVSGLNRCIHIVDTILSRLKRLNKEFLSSESNITTDCKT